MERYRGFSRFSFAVYNDTQAYIDGKTVDRPGEFIANKAVEYNGVATALNHSVVFSSVFGQTGSSRNT